MSKIEYSEDQLSEMREDAFVNIKEACMRLQERTKCGNDVVIKMLNEVSQFYVTQDEKNKLQFNYYCLAFLEFIFF